MSHIRAKAKLNGLMVLRGSWIKAMIALGIVMLLSFGISKLDDAYRLVFNVPILTSDNYLNTNIVSFIIEAVFTVISFFVLVPLILGMLEWYWNLTGGKHTGVGDVFAWYGSLRLYTKSLLLNLDIFVRCLLWGLLTCGLPTAMIAFASYYSRGLAAQSANLTAAQMQKVLISGVLILFGVVLLLGGILLFLYLVTRYILAYFLMVEDNTRKVRDVMKESINYSKKYRWELTKFLMSYIGWALFCIAALPILFVVPYFCSSTAIFAKHIIYSQRSNEKNDDVIKDKVDLSKS
jgi:uncharacterized membrane protein